MNQAHKAAQAALPPNVKPGSATVCVAKKLREPQQCANKSWLTNPWHRLTHVQDALRPNPTSRIAVTEVLDPHKDKWEEIGAVTKLSEVRSPYKRYQEGKFS